MFKIYAINDDDGDDDCVRVSQNSHTPIKITDEISQCHRRRLNVMITVVPITEAAYGLNVHEKGNEHPTS